jgi:hypothetical protein
MSEHAADRALPPALHETEDIRFGSMLGLFALIGGLLVLLVALAWLTFPGIIKDRRFAQPFPEWPAPRLQVSPSAEMSQFRSEEMRKLNSAGWRDRVTGTVRIPIDQAMRAVAAEGIPDWPVGANP